MHFRKWIALLTAAATMTMGMPAFAVQAGDADDWQTKYIKQLKADCPEPVPTDTELTLYKYSLADLFGDSVPELIISEGEYHMATAWVYTVQGDDVVSVGTFQEWGVLTYDATNGHLIDQYSNSGVFEATRYRFNEETGKLEIAVSYSNNEGAVISGAATYMINKERVTSEDYQKQIGRYDAHDFKTYGRDYDPADETPIYAYQITETVKPTEEPTEEPTEPPTEGFTEIFDLNLGFEGPFAKTIDGAEYAVRITGIFSLAGPRTLNSEDADDLTTIYNLQSAARDCVYRAVMDVDFTPENYLEKDYAIEKKAVEYFGGTNRYGYTLCGDGLTIGMSVTPATPEDFPTEYPTEPVTDPTEPVTDPTEPATDSTENVTISITELDTPGLVTYTGEPVTKTAPLVNVSGAVVKEAAFEVLDAKSYPFSVKVGSEIEVKEYRDADAGLDPNSHGGEYPVYYTVYAPVTITLTDENTPSGSYSMRLRCTKLVDENGNNLLLNYKDGDLISKWDLTLNNETERTGPEILYKDVLDFFRKNISEGWANFEDEDIFYGVDNSGGSSAVSYMWKRYLAENTLDEVGYDFLDVNNDGVPELLIGLLGQDQESGIGDNCSTIMDAYTYYNGKVVHLCSGGERVDIGIRLNGFVESGSAGAASYVTTQYALRNGALVPTECWKTDYDNKEMPNAYSKTPVLREENGYSYYEFTDWKAFDDSATVVTAEPFTIVTFGSQSAPEPADPEVMYKDILDMFRKNISENWANYEGGTEYGLIMEEKEPTVSYMWLRYNMTLGLEETGYLFLDIDEDGTPELLVGTPRESKAGSDLTWVGDIYTYYNGKAVHLASSGERDLFSIGKKEIIEMGSGSAASSITAFYHVSEGGLVPYEAYSYDAATYPKNPYLHSTTPKIITADGMSYYDFEWEQITEAAYNEGSEIHPIVYFPAILFAEPAGTLGDVDGSGSINASDAAKVLIAAASIGGGKDSGLTKAQETVADVNGDGSINATDAALILQYAAYVGGNGTDTFPEFLKNRDNNQQ